MRPVEDPADPVLGTGSAGGIVMQRTHRFRHYPNVAKVENASGVPRGEGSSGVMQPGYATPDVAQLMIRRSQTHGIDHRNCRKIL